MSYRVAEDRVLVQVHKQPDKSKGGILLPEQQRQQISTGEVRAAGDDTGYGLGDILVFPAYAGFEIEPGLRVLKSEDVLAEKVD